MTGTANAVNGPEAAPYVAKSGGTMTGALILNTSSPTTPLQAASKGYVDFVAQGLNILTAAYAATTANLNATYNNVSVPPSGIGATLTDASGTFAAFTVDGVSPPLNSRILVKNQGTTLENGVYVLTTNGDTISIPWVLTRAIDYDEPSEINPGDMILIDNGTQRATSWVETVQVNSVGVDPIVWSQFGMAFPVSVVNGGTSGTTFTPFSILAAGTTATGAFQNVVGVGTTGQVLTSAGAGALPTWQTHVSVINPNVIIGGNFDTNPWQRGTSFATLSTNTFTADRFQWGVVGTGVVTVSKAADAPAVGSVGFLATNCLKALVTTADGAIAAGDLYYFRYVVEGYDWTQLAQAACTLTFWVKATVTGIYTLALKNSGSDQSYVAEYTVNATNTWEQKTLLIPASPSAGTWDYTNGIGVQIFWNVAAGNALAGAAGAWSASNIQTTVNQVNGMGTNGNVFQLDLIKLEQGSTATAWQFRSEQQELSLCLRYYQSYGGVSIETMSSGWANTTSEAQAMFNFVETMRAAPTITVSAAGDFSIQYANTDTAATSFSVGVVSSNKAQFSVGCAAVLTIGQGIGFNAKVATTGARLMLLAEL